MKFFLEKKALILTEAMMTISILVTCAIIAGAMFTNAVNTTAVSKDFLIANGLAIEGAEAVKNIVYTNKMLYPTKPACWLNIDPEVVNCAVTASFGSNYIPIEKADNAQTKGKWKLGNGNVDDLDLEKKLSSAATYLLYLDNVTKKYTTVAANSVASKFYRSIKFLDVANDDSYATFEVKVAWFEGVKAWTTSSVVNIINQ